MPTFDDQIRALTAWSCVCNCQAPFAGKCLAAAPTLGLSLADRQPLALDAARASLRPEAEKATLIHELLTTFG